MRLGRMKRCECASSVRDLARNSPDFAVRRAAYGCIFDFGDTNDAGLFAELAESYPALAEVALRSALRFDEGVGRALAARIIGEEWPGMERQLAEAVLAAPRLTQWKAETLQDAELGERARAWSDLTAFKSWEEAVIFPTRIAQHGARLRESNL